MTICARIEGDGVVWVLDSVAEKYIHKYNVNRKIEIDRHASPFLVITIISWEYPNAIHIEEKKEEINPHL